ncbi:MAG: hypothetical protein IJI37_06000, partial [Opitutales bacterium]|nr:hypothetical protein [Opitutales bacterium]
SNLVGMGVLPFEFAGGEDAQTLGLDGTETFTIECEIAPAAKGVLKIRKADGSEKTAALLLRVDTPIEAEYYKADGILPFVLKKIIDKR